MNLHLNIDVFWSNWCWNDDCSCWIGDNHACHKHFSRNLQIFHVHHNFLLGLPTITSILRRISLVRSSNTTNFSDIYFFSLFINNGSFGRNVSKGNPLSCLVLLQEHFSKKWQIHFLHIFLTFFVSFGHFWSSFSLSKNLLWLDLRWFAGLKCISNKRIYQYHEHLTEITTFAPFITPLPIVFGRQSAWGRNQAFFPLQCKTILLCNFFPTWGRVKLSSAKMQSYPSQQILPILCREAFFPIMQNFYKSFPTNLYPFFFLHFSFYLYFLFIYFS